MKSFLTSWHPTPFQEDFAQEWNTTRRTTSTERLVTGENVFGASYPEHWLTKITDK